MTRRHAETLVVIAPQGIPEKRPRLEKTIRLAASRGWVVEYWGWARTPAEVCGATMPGVTRSRTLLRGGGYQGLSVRYRYVLWVLRVFFATIRYRPHAIWALGLETALPVWLASKFVGVRYVFDDADRFVLLFNLPGVVRRVITALERCVSGQAVTHVIPGPGRYDYTSASMQVVGNVPDSSQIDRAFRTPIDRPDASLVVYVNGWLAPVRGLRFIEAIASRLEEDRHIQFLLATKMSGDEGDLLGQLSNVKLLGSLDQVTALAYYKVSDLVITFYDPAIAINRYAEPNKWGDAAKMGTALLVNEEVRTADSWVKAGAAFTVPWNDTEAACELLRRLAADRSSVEAAIQVVLQEGLALPSFDDSVTPILERLAAASEAQELRQHAPSTA